METTQEDKIDTNLYSRQIGTFGMETMGKLIKMKVLIVGMRGVGVETCKNLALAGPKSIEIYDPTVVGINDLGSNFYIRESHVGKCSRAEASAVQLKELNSNVKISVIEKLSIEDLANYHVVCYTENLSGLKNLVEANTFCHQKNIGFILCETLGLLGYTFTDFGEKHAITDQDGEQCKSFMVVAISQDEKANITVHEDKRHTYQEGDHVKFVEVEGMTGLNSKQTYEITKVRGPYSFQIDYDSREQPAYTRQGLVENVKVTSYVQHHSLAQSYLKPQESAEYGMLTTVDMRNWGRGDHLHIALRAIHDYHTQKGSYPEIGDADAVVEIAKALNQKAKEAGEFTCEELEEAVVRGCASFASCSIVPQAAFFGGIVAQEIVKYTGKYSPIKQWLHYDILESVDFKKECNREPMNCRYDDQIKIFGRENQEKLGNIKTFMVGAGALGCEYMKAFAMMGLGCGPKGEVHCTDNDNIEVSNLNRQFLFRQQHVTKSKSQTACQIAKEMNPALNVTAYVEYVDPATEHIFNDQFWEGLDFIVNAVDNIKARLYVDQKCVWYEKPLLESGTLGTKANSQMVVPFMTKCYGDSQDPPEEGIPMCTLRNFPNLIEHCIEWGREQFNGTFVTRVQDTVNFIENPDQFLANLRQNTTSSGAIDSLKEVCKIINLKKNANFAGCMQVARESFDSYFEHQINDLLGMFPADAKTKEGSPFWSGPKRCPTPAAFNVDDDIHFQFIWSCANLIAFNLNIDQVRNEKEAKAIAAKTTAKPYIRTKIVVETPEEAKEREAKNLPPPTPVSGADDEEDLKMLMVELKSKIQDNMDVQAIEFEKDDADNFHIDYIHSTANIRARNYQITECDFGKTKMIAGRIIPAIATTTAMITGGVAAEFYKFTQGWTELVKFKNFFINLAISYFMVTEPDEIAKVKSKEYDPIMAGPVKAIPEGYTIYDKTLINEGSLTFQEFFDYLKKTINCDISMVACGKVALYNAYLPSQAHKPRLQEKMEDVYLRISKDQLPASRYYLVLEVSGETCDSGEDFVIPPVKYCFKPSK